MAKPNQAQLALDDIRALILKNKLAPGSFISEASLCEQLSYGRTPIREALIRLSCEGLINVHPRRGLEVCYLTPRKLYNIYEIRQLVEPRFIEDNFEKIDKDQLPQLRKELERSREMVRAREPDALYHGTQLDMKLHVALISASGNSEYINIMHQFFDYMTMVRVSSTFNYERFIEGVAEHVDIVDAVLNGEKEKTLALIEAHIRDSYHSLVEDLTSFS